jgi:prevent-host-death family protein
MDVATNEVGVRELKNKLSAYLDRVKDGEEVVVTDRGKPVARLVPIDRSTERLNQLIAAGLVTPPRRPKSKARPSIKANGTVSDLLAEQRR